MTVASYSETGPWVLRFCIKCMNNVLVHHDEGACPLCGRVLRMRTGVSV